MGHRKIWRPQSLIHIDISYTIGKQIKYTILKSMFHDSSLECVERVINESSRKGYFSEKLSGNSKTPLHKCYHLYEIKMFYREFDFFGHFNMSHWWFESNLVKKTHHSLPIGRLLSENQELTTLVNFTKFWSFRKEKWKNKNFQSLVCYYFFQTSKLVTNESRTASWG